jgi:hypothetical protein
VPDLALDNREVTDPEMAALWPDWEGKDIAGPALRVLCTSLMLIAAAPPLLFGYPPGRLRWSAEITSICLSGAVTASPSKIATNGPTWNGSHRPPS